MTWEMRVWDSDELNVDGHVDSAGPERESTSGGMMMVSGTEVKHWSTQTSRPLLVTESNYSMQDKNYINNSQGVKKCNAIS